MSTPQATPKHLTDEELRQQYGIQLASRPDDSDDKGAKWADIDDEEDDWAPDTIEWNDGTKINLAQADPLEAGLEASQESAVKEPGKSDGVNKSAANIVKPTTVGPNATVLKLGAASHHRSPSLSAKGSSDKPTLVAKPSAPAPVKSPWAPLPAVDKVSPVPINSPVQASSHSRFGQNDAHGFDAMPPPPGPQAKEIAADDFSRFSRETPDGMPKELYVPQSGRYEPVNESRRGSTRKESTFRQPSLLQRPSQNDQQGPAEPSAAFQTNRTQQETASWTRRRASSTVSGESGKFGRRMSIGKGLDSPSVVSRRNSQFDPFAPAVPTARGPPRVASPAQSQGKSITSQSPTMSSAPDPTIAQQEQVAIISVATPEAPHEDPVVLQKRLMREKREAAIKRKKEEEEKEEAARKERIRLKMEKLGLTDEHMTRKDAVGTGPKARPNDVQNDKDTSTKAGKDTKGSKVIKEVSPSAAPQSPPKPPVPSVTGPPQQYGLMKVHASQPLSSSMPHPTASEKGLLDTASDGRPARSLRSQSPFSAGGSREQKAEANIVSQGEGRVDESNTEARPWTNLQQAQSPYSNWGASGGMTTHSSPGGNLWGPPTNHRALGNGDFQNNLQRSSLRPPQPPFSQQHLTSPPPQPIGTPRQAPQLRGVSSSNSSDLLSRSIIEDSQTIPAFPPTEPETLHLPSHFRNEPSPILRATNETQHPISSSTAVKMMTQVSTPVQPSTGRQAWADFSVTIGRKEQEAAERTAHEHATRMAEQQLSGIVTTPQLPAFNETWKQVKRGETHGQRQVVNNVKTQDNNGSQASIGDIPKVPGSVAPALAVRSRYSDIFEKDHRAPNSLVAVQRPESPTAPPPDSVDHPAYVGLSHRPLVNLPGSKPKAEKPVVKLPPIAAALVQHPLVDVDPRVPVPSVHRSSLPLVSNPNWQDRFNGLFNRGKISSPEKKFAHATDFSASKEPLDLNPVGFRSTAVALPSDLGSGLKEAPGKAVEDENALFEERSFGSTPTVKIPPPIVLSPSWEPAKEPKVDLKRAKLLALKNDDIFSIPYAPYDETPRGPTVAITIYMPGMDESKTKTLHRPAPHYAGRGKNYSIKGKHRQGPKAKEPNSPQGPPKSGQSNASRSQVQTTNTVKPKPKQSTPHATWSRKASAVAQ